MGNRHIVRHPKRHVPPPYKGEAYNYAGHMVADTIIMQAIPCACICDWRPADYTKSGPQFAGWLLKFRNLNCPAEGIHG